MAFSKMASEHNYSKIAFVMYQLIHITSTLLGLAPCSVKISTPSAPEVGFTCLFSHSRVKCFYNILLIGLYIAIMVRSVPALNNVQYPNNSSVGRMIGLALGIMGNAIPTVIIIYYLIFQRDIIRIGNQMNQFDKTYGAKLIAKSDRGIGNLKIYAIVVIIFVIWIGVLITEYMLPQGMIYIVTSSLNEGFVSWLLVQYSLVIHVLENRIRGLNKALLDSAVHVTVFTEGPLVRRSVASDSLIIQNLIMIKKARNYVLKLSRQISKFYTFPVLLIICYCCCSCIDTGYFYIMTLMLPEKKGDNNVLIDAIFCVLMNFYPIIILSTSVNSFQAETEHTADIVYDMMETCAAHKDVELSLNNFAVELLHKKVSFNACGLFSLDCTLLHSILAMIATYLLILVQFKPLG
ncbi:gustatory receptor for sugar taste 43a-like [Diachasmimorpha longicaudata]|uniref:gustatory receptor for sugar taste 43a-like n=1 Tax=Diachasmimorpha longicaudata TaxID=58733 RepID=UPI0030B87784